MKHFVFLVIFSLLIAFSACNEADDFRLSSSIFISDKDYPDLPIYSECGYNTFGVYFDRTPFISDNYLLPVKVVVDADTCCIGFTGKYRFDNAEATLTFHLAGYAPKTYSDLLQLNKRKIQLTSDECLVTFRKGNNTDTLRITKGELEIKRAQPLIVDKEELKSVLSGLFSFTAIYKDVPVSVNFGRFDVTVGSMNFFENN